MKHASALKQIPPLFFYAAALIAGISWQCNIFCPQIYQISGILLSLLIFIAYQFSAVRFTLIIPGIIFSFFIGALRSCIHEYTLQNAQQRLCNRQLTVLGTVLDNETDGKRCTIELQAVMADGYACSQPNISIQIQSKDRLICTRGDHVLIPKLQLRSATKNYFKKQNIFASATCNATTIKTIKQQSCNIYTRNMRWLDTQRAAVLQSVQTQCRPETFSLLSSLFFGCNNATDLLREEFQWWGISHYLARSGLHLVIFVMMLQWLFIWLPCTITTRRFFAIVCIALYALFSWTSVSFARSILMIYALFLCYYFQIRSHAIHNVSLACCIILFYNPAYLITLDFQLSFALTLALALFNDAMIFRKVQLHLKS